MIKLLQLDVELATKGFKDKLLACAKRFKEGTIIREKVNGVLEETIKILFENQNREKRLEQQIKALKRVITEKSNQLTTFRRKII